MTRAGGRIHHNSRSSETTWHSGCFSLTKGTEGLEETRRLGKRAFLCANQYDSLSDGRREGGAGRAGEVDGEREKNTYAFKMSFSGEEAELLWPDCLVKILRSETVIVSPAISFKTE